MGRSAKRDRFFNLPNDEEISFGGLVAEEGSTNEIVVECGDSLSRINVPERFEGRFITWIEEEGLSDINLSIAD